MIYGYLKQNNIVIGSVGITDNLVRKNGIIMSNIGTFETDEILDFDNYIYHYVDDNIVKTVNEGKLQKAKDLKCKEIDSNTASKITNLVGSDVNQRNLTAKSSQLLLKKLNDDITDEELDLLNSLNGMFAQVEQWIVDGNTLEAEVQEMTTIEDVEAVEV